MTDQNGKTRERESGQRREKGQSGECGQSRQLEQRGEGELDRNVEKKLKAAALAYDHTGVPRVVAKGSGELAKQIIQQAQVEGIPVQTNEVLVEALLKVELTKAIPPELYQAVAEILAFVYRLEQAAQRSDKGST